jgi:transcriptional regulator with XRE-family HTH domain
MKQKQETTGERIERIRGNRSQVGFGELLGGASQSAVSAWERDDKDRAPSAAIYFRLAALADDPDDAVFFLQEGGVPSEAVISVANALLKKGDVKVDTILAMAETLLNEQLGDQRKRAKEGKDVIVPPYRDAPRLPFDVSVPASLVSNQAATFYLVAGSQNLMGQPPYAVPPGEIVVFESHEPSYGGLVGEKLVFEFDDGLAIGRLGYMADEAGHHLVLGPANQYPRNWGGPASVRTISSFIKRRDLVTGHHKLRDVRRFFGIWIAQFSGAGDELWKKAARVHAPKE